MSPVPMRLTAGNNDNKVSVGCIDDAERWKRDMGVLGQNEPRY